MNASQLIKLERSQQWFLKNIFYVPVFAPSSLLLKLSGLKSTEAEIDLKKVMFLGRLITEPKMAPAVRHLFSSRFESFLDANITSRGVLATIYDSLHKYNLFHYLELCMVQRIYFPHILELENNLKKRQMIGFVFAVTIKVCEWLKHVLRTFPPVCSGPLYPDLVSRLHVQIRLMENVGLNGGVPWLTNTDGELCLFCKNSVEDVSHFFSDCSSFRDNFESLWSNLSQKLIPCNPSDGLQISHFISSLDRQQKLYCYQEVFLSLLTELHSP